MKILQFRNAVGLAAGAAVTLLAGYTYAATFTLNLEARLKDVEAAGKGPLSLVADTDSAAVPGVPSRPAVARPKKAGNAVVAPEHAETGAEIVGRLLAPQASDPDVPLPHPDLATKSEAERPLAGPTVFGRREPGGGVLGLRVPIPVDRSGSGGATRYGTPSDKASGASTIR